MDCIPCVLISMQAVAVQRADTDFPSSVFELTFTLSACRSLRWKNLILLCPSGASLNSINRSHKFTQSNSLKRSIIYPICLELNRKGNADVVHI